MVVNALFQNFQPFTQFFKDYKVVVYNGVDECVGQIITATGTDPSFAFPDPLPDRLEYISG